ncbi:MAG: HD domain-containing phosphohydrolase [Anaerolineales bacterium]
MTTPIRILYVDDYPLDRELVRDALEKEHGGFEVIEAASRSAFETILGKGDFDLVLSDFNILGFEGLQVLEAVHAKDPSLPVIIVTGTGSEEVASEAIKRGAADYVIKTPRHIQRLPHTIHAALEEKQTKEALRASEARYRLLHESMRDCFAQVNMAGEIVDVNPAFLDMLGYSKEEVLGLHYTDITPQRWHKTEQEIVDTQILPLGYSAIYEKEYTKKDGSAIPIELRTFLLHDAEGKPSGMWAIVRDITERKQAEQEIHRRLLDLQVLYESSLGLSSQLTPAEIGLKIIDILKEYLDWHHAVVRLRQEQGDELEIIGYAAPGVTPKNYAAEIKRLNSLVGQVGQGMNGWVIQHGEGVRCGDLPSDPRYIETYPGIHSGLYAPMIAGEKTIGAIAIESEAANAFNDLDERLLATLAKITANAIHRSRLREQTEHQLQRLRALRAIDQAISASFDLHITLDIFLKNAVSQLSVDAALLLLFNPAMNTLDYAAESGFRSTSVRKIHLRLGEQGAGQVALERQRMSIPDLRKVEKPFVHPELAADEGFISYHAVPLIVKGQIKGVLEVFQRTLLEPDAEWLAFLETLAGQAAIGIDNNQLFENLQRSNFELAVAYDETIEGWSKALDLRDRETEGHTQRVTRLTQEMGAFMGMNESELVLVRRGALLHDIGKMGVPDSILLKPGELTPEEWAIMRQHPRFAYDMLSPITYLRQALEIPYCHHEKWDGTGYPRGLKGKGIPITARIFAIVDVYDALTSDRPYRKAWSTEKTLDYIREQSGKQFDPEVVETFLKVIATVK